MNRSDRDILLPGYDLLTEEEKEILNRNINNMAGLDSTSWANGPLYLILPSNNEQIPIHNLRQAINIRDSSTTIPNSNASGGVVSGSTSTNNSLFGSNNGLFGSNNGLFGSSNSSNFLSGGLNILGSPGNSPPASGNVNDDEVITIIKVLDGGTDTNGTQLIATKEPFVLPCPSNLIDIHSVNFEGRDFGTANYQLNAAAGATSRYDMGGAMYDRFKDYAGSRVQYTLGGLNTDYFAEQLNILGRKGDDLGYDVYSVGKGVAINPNTELVFRGVNIREFQLNWKLINIGDNKAMIRFLEEGSIDGKRPRSSITNTPAYANLLLKFYYQARMLMYPVVDERFASGYPAKFTISVTKNDNLNLASASTRKKLVSIGEGKLKRNGKQMGCYIKDLQLDYIPSDSSFGASVSSYPTIPLDSNKDFKEISLSMTVQEAALMNRDSILNSY